MMQPVTDHETQVLTNFLNPLLQQLLARALQNGTSFHIEVNNAVRSYLNIPAVDETEIDMAVLIAQAVERARALANGEIFYLGDLCSPEQWHLLGSGARKALGKAFRKAVEQATPPIALHTGRDSANRAVYQRV